MDGFESQPPPQPAEKAPEPPRFQPGTMVKVERSSGDIEDKWFVVGNKDGRVRVMNLDGDLVKDIPEGKMDNLNPPVERVTSWDGLMYAINQLPDTVQGSKQVFDKAQISELVQRVRDGRLNERSITRSHGLRDKVIELLEQDTAQKS